MVAAHERASRTRRVAARYRSARRSLRTPASARSRHGLDWTNFFIADVQTGFGTFEAFYLANLGWSTEMVGLALTTGGLAGVLGQIPGGALADSVSWKRGLVALGIVMICASALVFAFTPSLVLVFAAAILQGLTSGIVTPAITAISLGLVGRKAMSLRTGRNYRFDAAGNSLTAAAMGTLGSALSTRMIFVAAAALCLPALAALSWIKGSEIDYARARNAAPGEHADKIHRVRDLAGNRRLLLFALVLSLFQLANASLLPLLAEELGTSKAASGSLLISGLIIAPQVVVALAAPWVGYHSEAQGRRPLLVLGLGLETVRAALLAVVTDYRFMILIQLLDGLGGAIVSVLTVLVIADLTTGTGRFNLARGAVGAAMGVAASVSTAASGFVVEQFGHWAGFLAIAAVFGAATAIAWAFLGETKPAQYLD